MAETKIKKVIIAVHGLGNKPPKYLLKKWWKDAIKEGFNKNAIKCELPELELVYWADILHEKPLNKWEKNTHSPYYLDEPYKKSPKHIFEKENAFKQSLIGFISSKLNKIFLNEDRSLRYSFVTDFIIHKYFKDLEAYYTEDSKGDVTRKSKYLIRRRILEVINKYKDYEIMIIAHSMGSIITFDVLTFLLPKIKIHTLVTIGSPLGVPFVVSKTASEYKKNPNNQKFMTTPPGVLNNWFNLADNLDEVALNYKLKDEFKANEYGVVPADFKVTNDYEINNRKNPHKSFGYLRTPEMSKILDDFINKKKVKFTNKVVEKLGQLADNIKEQTEFVKDRLNIE